jgi:Flp pilus assembly pilin Flp
VDERDKRDTRQFEPPPWEQEAFKEFHRIKAEQEQEAALEEALAVAKARTDEGPAEAADQEADEAAEGVEGVDVGQQEVPTKGVSSAELETMLIGLKNQEPADTKNYAVIVNVVSAFLAAGGVGFVVWAASMFSKVGPEAGATPMLASLMLMVWGLILIGGAAMLFKKFNLT